MNDVLGLQARISARPEEVYEALTDESALTTWLAEHAVVSPDEDRYGFWGPSVPQGDRAHQRLLAMEPGRLLRFEWTLDDRATVVEIELAGDGRDTVLSLRQDGMPTLEELMNPPGRRDGLHSMHTFWGLALASLAEHVEGRQLTPRADFRPERAPEIRVRMEIGAPPEAVFASLTDSALASRWFGWEVEVEPRLGGAVTLGAEGKIFEFEPGKGFAYEDGEGSITRWELEGSDGRTFLTFVQSGYTEDEWDSAAQHEAGWLGSLADLKRMHELGDAWTPLTTELPSDEQDGDAD